ncbi:MAG: P-II family nitrogen regulator [Oscillospiraceae bacterium]|nr:P-II family nitrogen regulator [Oscillospiraceae bacterium]
MQEALSSIDVTGITVTNVMGYGIQSGHHDEYYRGAKKEASTLLPKVKIEVVVANVPVETVVETARKTLYTGSIGDGKIFIYDVEDVIKVRTGERGKAALIDVNR